MDPNFQQVYQKANHFLTKVCLASSSHRSSLMKIEHFAKITP